MEVTKFIKILKEKELLFLGKYVDRYQAGINIVLLEPDVAQAFPTSDSVNEALRLLMQIAQRQKAKTH